MFKILKENKIVGISERNPVLLDKYDIEEDTDHTIDDYVQVNGEYVLKTSDEAIEQKKAERIAELQNRLSATDWYAVRFAETGVEIPDEIKVERQAAREEISRLREESEADNG